MAREKRIGGMKPRRCSTSFSFKEKKMDTKNEMKSECLRCGYLNPKDRHGNKNMFFKCHAGSCPAIKEDKKSKGKNNRWERKRRITLDPVIDPKSGAYGDV